MPRSPLRLVACKAGTDPVAGLAALRRVVGHIQTAQAAAEELAVAAEAAIREEFRAIRGTDEDPWDEPSFIDTTLGDQQLAGFRAWVATQPDERQIALLADEPAPNYDHEGELRWRGDRDKALSRARERLGVAEELWDEKWYRERPTEGLERAREARQTGTRCIDFYVDATKAAERGEKVPLPDGVDLPPAPFIEGTMPTNGDEDGDL